MELQGAADVNELSGPSADAAHGGYWSCLCRPATVGPSSFQAAHYAPPKQNSIVMWLKGVRVLGLGVVHPPCSGLAKMGLIQPQQALVIPSCQLHFEGC